MAPSEQPLKHDEQPTQKTQPKRGKPVEIPIPTREDVMRNLAKAAAPEKPKK
jgi:hypothetical protein